MIAFKAKLKNDKAYEYSDDLFDGLEFSHDDLSGEDSERFTRHYFSGYKNFVKHGAKSDHRNYQMHVLDD